MRLNKAEVTWRAGLAVDRTKLGLGGEAGDYLDVISIPGMKS